METKIADAIRLLRDAVGEAGGLNDADHNAINRALNGVETAIAQSGIWPNEDGAFTATEDARLKAENDVLRAALHEAVLQVIHKAMPRREGEE